MIPGELITAEGEIILNEGKQLTKVSVANIGDRPIQIGSHYHFYEANEGLIFDRDKTLGFRLNIASGTAVRFEPGQERTVELVEFAGDLPPLLFDHAKKGELENVAEQANYAPNLARLTRQMLKFRMQNMDRSLALSALTAQGPQTAFRHNITKRA